MCAGPSLIGRMHGQVIVRASPGLATDRVVHTDRNNICLVGAVTVCKLLAPVRTCLHACWLSWATLAVVAVTCKCIWACHVCACSSCPKANQSSTKATHLPAPRSREGFPGCTASAKRMCS